MLKLRRESGGRISVIDCETNEKLAMLKLENVLGDENEFYKLIEKTEIVSQEPLFYCEADCYKIYSCKRRKYFDGCNFIENGKTVGKCELYSPENK